jgi:tetratricopeptide (TPR) repeat protein
MRTVNDSATLLSLHRALFLFCRLHLRLEFRHSNWRGMVASLSACKRQYSGDETQECEPFFAAVNFGYDNRGMKILKWIRGGLSDSEAQARAQRDVRSLMYEAHALLDEQQYDGARHVLLRALELWDRIVERATIDWLLMSLGSTWLFQERFSDQMAFFSDYVSRYPMDCAAYCERAAALWYTGRLLEALEDYSRALELDPTHAQSRSGRGQVLAELGEAPRAIEDLDIALRILLGASTPNDSWGEWKRSMEAFVRNGRAVAFAYLGKTRDAMNEFETSVRLGPDNAWVYFNRARVHESCGDKTRSISDYRTSLGKTQPPLSPRQKEQAHQKIWELESASSEL